eukprot:5805746-Prymnesium_polylepis.1
MCTTRAPPNPGERQMCTAHAPPVKSKPPRAPYPPSQITPDLWPPTTPPPLVEAGARGALLTAVCSEYRNERC